MSRLFESARLSESAIERHTVDTLAYLVASGRLQMRVVLMDRGMYHRKIWLFGAGDKWLAVHGSGECDRKGATSQRGADVHRTSMGRRRAVKELELEPF